MSLPSFGATIAQAAILIFPPIILASAALKIRFAWLDRPFSRRANPVHFWIEVVCVLAFVSTLLILHLVSDRPQLDNNLMMGAVLMGQGAGNWASDRFQSAKQPSKLEFASTRESSDKPPIGIILLWCLAVAMAVWAYIALLGGTR